MSLPRMRSPEAQASDCPRALILRPEQHHETLLFLGLSKLSLMGRHLSFPKTSW